ncbi:MAG TPA: hypothetical protein VGA22_05235 [Gemmatimonadales bacterium]|jgi:hypothetical protein
MTLTPSSWPPERTRKFRQAAFIYLHLGILYEAAAWVMWGQGMLPYRFGPPWLFLLLGAGIVAAVFWGLYAWQNVWVARVVWGVQAFRFPPLISRAFVEQADSRMPPAFYVAAIIIVLISMWSLARAGWDL